MIFVTVGTVMPFNRLIRAVDNWAALNPAEAVTAQIGDGAYVPSSMRWVRRMDGKTFAETVNTASLIVSHAGTGTLFAAIQYKKPIVIVPRYAAHKEHTTDHQRHTAKWLGDHPGVVVADMGDDIGEKIKEARSIRPSDAEFSLYAPSPFLDRIRMSIEG